MAEYILVKTPLTIDGNMPLFGEDGKRVYSESVLRNVGNPSAKQSLEKRNTQLPEALRMIIEDYDGPLAVKAPNEQPIDMMQMKPPTVKNVTNAKA